MSQSGHLVHRRTWWRGKHIPVRPGQSYWRSLLLHRTMLLSIPPYVGALLYLTQFGAYLVHVCGRILLFPVLVWSIPCCYENEIVSKVEALPTHHLIYEVDSTCLWFLLIGIHWLCGLRNINTVPLHFQVEENYEVTYNLYIPKDSGQKVPHHFRFQMGTKVL